jgi:hypothetical protein
VVLDPGFDAASCSAPGCDVSVAAAARLGVVLGPTFTTLGSDVRNAGSLAGAGRPVTAEAGFAGVEVTEIGSATRPSPLVSRVGEPACAPHPVSARPTNSATTDQLAARWRPGTARAVEAAEVPVLDGLIAL